MVTIIPNEDVVLERSGPEVCQRAGTAHGLGTEAVGDYWIIMAYGVAEGMCACARPEAGR